MDGPSPSRGRNLVFSNEPHAKWGAANSMTEPRSRQLCPSVPSVPNDGIPEGWKDERLFSAVVNIALFCHHSETQGRRGLLVALSAVPNFVWGSLLKMKFLARRRSHLGRDPAVQIHQFETGVENWACDRKRGPHLPLEFLVHKQTAATARTYELHDRGVISPGYRADVNVIDFANLHLERPIVVHDLPAGGKRIVQHSVGYKHTFVRGTEVRHDDEDTGARPGRLRGRKKIASTTLPRGLGGARVLLDTKTNAMLFSSRSQTTFITRSTIRVPGPIYLNFELDGDPSSVFEIPIVPSNPGIFALDASGAGQGAILNPDGTVNSFDNPSDSFIVAFGTGGGKNTPQCPDGGLGPAEEPLPRLQPPATATIGGAPADVLYAGSAPGLVCGVNQWTLMPTNNPVGAEVPVKVCAGDNCTQEGITAAFK